MSEQLNRLWYFRSVCLAMKHFWSHVVISNPYQQHLMQSSSKQPKIISNSTSIQFSISQKQFVNTNTMPASKLLMLQQNHIKDSPIMSTNSGSSTTPYSNGQQNGSTKVVLVTSEPMEMDHNRNGKTATAANNGNDEELTSLTWLHDKNLLKGN